MTGKTKGKCQLQELYNIEVYPYIFFLDVEAPLISFEPSLTGYSMCDRLINLTSGCISLSYLTFLVESPLTESFPIKEGYEDTNNVAL